MTTKGWILTMIISLVCISFLTKTISRKSKPKMADFAEKNALNNPNNEHYNQSISLTQNQSQHER